MKWLNYTVNKLFIAKNLNNKQNILIYNNCVM